MSKNSAEVLERLIRVFANRRGSPVELSVHYKITLKNECQMYQILTIEDAA